MEEKSKGDRFKFLKNMEKRGKFNWKAITMDKWLLIGAAGIVLVLCSDWANCGGQNALSDVEEDDSSYNKQSANEALYQGTAGNYADGMSRYTQSLEEELEDILEAIEGAGAVEVMITLKNSTSKEVLMEEPYTENYVTETDGDGGTRDTKEKSVDYRVIYEENDGMNSPFVISETSPQVEGVAVVAEGGDSAVIKEKITSIIKALFGIEINKIAVGKMK